MATKKTDFATKSAAELTKLLSEMRADLRASRFAFAGARGKDAAEARLVRRNVARILTALRAKELLGEQEVAETVSA